MTLREVKELDAAVGFAAKTGNKSYVLSAQCAVVILPLSLSSLTSHSSLTCVCFGSLCSFTGTKVPTLQEAIELCKELDLMIYLDVNFRATREQVVSAGYMAPPLLITYTHSHTHTYTHTHMCRPPCATKYLVASPPRLSACWCAASTLSSCGELHVLTLVSTSSSLAVVTFSGLVDSLLAVLLLMWHVDVTCTNAGCCVSAFPQPPGKDWHRASDALCIRQ